MTVSIWPSSWSSRNSPAPSQRAERPADHQHPAHQVIDPAAPAVREHSRNARPGDLAGRRSRRDGRRDPVEDQQRRGQEPAADPEHPREDAHQPAQPDDDQAVDRKVRDGEIDVHPASRPSRWRGGWELRLPDLWDQSGSSLRSPPCCEGEVAQSTACGLAQLGGGGPICRKRTTPSSRGGGAIASHRRRVRARRLRARASSAVARLGAVRGDLRRGADTLFLASEV